MTSLHEFVALVPFVVKCSEGQHVQEKKRSANSHGHTQLSGVVPRHAWKGSIDGPLRTIRRIRWIGGDFWVSCGVGARMRDLPPGASRRQSSGDRAGDVYV